MRYLFVINTPCGYPRKDPNTKIQQFLICHRKEESTRLKFKMDAREYHTLGSYLSKSSCFNICEIPGCTFSTKMIREFGR